MEDQFTLLGLIKILWRWKKPIIVTCIIAGLISIFSSLTLDNYYQASTIFYPASQDNFKPEKVFGGGVEYFYGGREDLDRLMSIAQSSELKDYLIEEFDLYDVYELNPDGELGKMKVRKALGALFTVSKTKFSAVEIAVEDKDPSLARKMANSARTKTDEILQRMMKERLISTMTTIEKDIETKTALVFELNDSLRTWRERYGLYDTDAQSEILSTLVSETESNLSREKARFNALKNNPSLSRDTIAILKANVTGLEEQFRALTSKDSESRFNVHKFNQGKEKIRTITQRVDIESTQINYQKLKLAQYKVATDFDFNAIYVVEDASEPFQKSRPRRSILVMGTVLIVFLLSVIGVLVLDRLKGFDWKSLD